MKLNEYDVVRSTRSLAPNVPDGTTGTIMMVYEAPRLAYEVEFIEAGEILSISTVMPEDVELLSSEELEILKQDSKGPNQHEGLF